MQDSPLVVCLDNNDYSVLSDSSRASPELEAIRYQLLKLAESGSVVYAFAGTHLMEMAPLQPTYADAAAARADVLVQLCGTNALVSFDQMLQLEVARAAGFDAPITTVLSTDASWFPKFDGSLLPAIPDPYHTDALKEAIRAQGRTRKERRKMERKVLRNGQPNALFKQFHANRAANFDVSETLRDYPMRPEDAVILARYVFGKASREEAEAAFLSALRDPRWMMRWFSEHHDLLSPVSRWIRDPSEKYIAGLQKAITGLQEIRRTEKATGRKIPIDLLTAAGWKAAQHKLLLKLANGVLASSYPTLPALTDVDAVYAHCPGLCTVVNTTYAAAWDSLRGQPRTPKPSDFADALHAFYAPYVSIFRADNYMAPHVAKHVKQYGTRVVPKLRDLPGEIAAALLR
ncbi:hypothetical protein AB4Z46_28445 [Variovorax sp. M-6]|uniref:hypothetical protein n=1 Tax=Variovorax sp. M-6 TaxID=3233041 RepID=UPI003F98393D